MPDCHRILLVHKQLGDPAHHRRADGHFDLVGFDSDNLLGRTSVGDLLLLRLERAL